MGQVIGKLCVHHDKPHMLVIGARGFLGGHVARKAASAFQVFRAALPRAGWEGLAIDITSTTSVEAAFQHATPDVVVLLAAISDIDACEKRPELAEEINVRGTARVVEACARSGAKLAFTSSAAVFDGNRHGYRESDAPTPLSVYGGTKARAEELVRQALPSAIILRLALVVGFAQDHGTNAMLNKLSEKLNAGQSVAFPNFEYRNPIDAETLAGFLLELLQLSNASGLFHVGASESISRFELGVKLAEKMSFSRDLIEPQTAPSPGRAPRGLDHFLLTENLRAVCQTPIPSCDEVIERAIHGTP
ncbi:MAG: NAD(P)-dependent oxidoreductase [Candidatus Acidiferrales bacterium]